jgi:coiled-coil domain-containing protein 130
VEELYDKAEVWRDPYDVNARLRRDFRAQRKVWKKEDRHKENMQEKFSLGLDIADETDADRARARMIDFGAANTEDGDEYDAQRKPLFAALEPEAHSAVVPAPKTKKLKAEVAAEQSRKSLQQTLVGNTRATLDPFLMRDSGAASRLQLGILKRKREDPVEGSVDASAPVNKAIVSSEAIGEKQVSKAPMPAMLVGYDSD